MTPDEPQKRSRRTLIAVLLAVLGVAVALGGIALLQSAAPSNSTPSAGPGGDTGTAAAAKATGRGRPLSSRAVYDLISPSVVDITATLGYDDETASGTGFFVDPKDGLVLTNNHVIRDATAVTVVVPGTRRSYQAQIVGADTGADIAVLRILPVPAAPSAPIGDSSAVSVGTTVIAIGNRAGAGGPPVLAAGVISGTGRTIAAADGASGFTETLHGMLQTTAKIQPGDSGGPLADAAGTVIGVDTAAGTGGAEAGYAIPINTAMAAERAIVSGRSSPGIVLGVGGFLGVIVPSTTAASPRAQVAAERSLGADPAGSASQVGCLPTEAGAGVPATVAPVKTGRAGGRGAVRHRGRRRRARRRRRDHHRRRARGLLPGRADRDRERLPAGQRGRGHLGQPGRRDPDVPGPARLGPRRVTVFPLRQEA